MFTAIAEFFAEEAEKGAITKKTIAEMLGKDPAQVTRWLAAPSNFELDTISDLLLAMGAEMDYRIVRFSERPAPNYIHPLLVGAPDLDDSRVSFAVELKSEDTKIRKLTPEAETTSDKKIRKKITPEAATTSSAELLERVP